MNNARASRWNWWWIAPALALALFIVHNVELNYFKQNLAVVDQQGGYPVQRDQHSQTGYRWEQRSQILYPDGYHWVMQTQRMLAEGAWRVRQADYDNSPHGREVHWSGSMHWWLGGLAWLWSGVSDCPLSVAVEEVAPYANPILLLALILILVPLVWRWFGGTSAGVLALGMVTVAPFGELFGFADPDHHGLVAVCCMFTVLFLLVGGGGWVKNEGNAAANDDEKPGVRPQVSARRFFIASGVAGGAGLWISSATQAPVLIGIGLGTLGGCWWLRKAVRAEKTAGRFAPELWRWWGLSGAVASVFFYLLEYFPFHMGFRLEVNQPLYAIAWLGGGELLFRLSRQMTGGRFATPGRDQAVAVCAVVGVLLLPAVILTTSDLTFWVSDRMLWALHTDYIVEFSSVFRRLSTVSPSQWLAVFNPLPLLVLALCWCLFRRGLSGQLKARLVLAIVPAIMVMVLAAYQVRWTGISCALWLVVLVAVAGLLAREGFKPVLSPGWKVGLTLLAISVSLPWFVRTVSIGNAILHGEKGLSGLSLRYVVLRDLARWLRAREGGERECVVLGGPGVTTALIYHGGFKGVGTLYWENKDGLQSMIDIFSTSNDAVAKELIKKHGVTHVVVVSWDAFAAESSRLALGLRRGEQAPEDTFLTRLSKGHGCPFWLRPVHYPSLEFKAMKNDFVLVYEVVPEMSREEAALRYAQLLFERGEQQDAEKFLNLFVQHYPDYLPCWIELAWVQASLKHLEALRTSIGRVATLQSQADGLALDDRIGLATVFAMAGDTDGMRKQTQYCLEAADEKSMRRLNANTLLNLILLAQDTGEAASRPALIRQATELLPRDMRKQVQAAPGAR
jgi:hypothetical protein